MIADHAVDGNTDGDYFQNSCTHTSHVVIFNRFDCCQSRLNPFNIHIGDSSQITLNPKCGGDHNIDVSQPSISVSCQGMSGRYVGVVLPGSSRTMTLCEVQTESGVLFGTCEEEKLSFM
ncbi:fucolectin-like [Branchiostoma floridae x Branchiostoma belcheri]